jgi:hypothetical protein
VLLEVVKPPAGETELAPDMLAESPGPDGTLRLSYPRGGPGLPPTRFLRLRNTTNRVLYCALLDLTERFKVDGELCRSARLEPGATAPLNNGKLVDFFLPPDLENTPGVTYRDWLVLVVSTDEISAAPYEMPELGWTRRDIRSHRSAAAPPGDWCATTLPIVLTGPL